MIETLWNVSVLDIESTLRRACHKLDKDASVSAEVRVSRAKGLWQMGRIFEEKGVSAEEGLAAFEKQMMEGMEVAQNIEKHRKQQEEEEEEEHGKEDANAHH